MRERRRLAMLLIGCAVAAIAVAGGTLWRLADSLPAGSASTGASGAPANVPAKLST